MKFTTAKGANVELTLSESGYIVAVVNGSMRLPIMAINGNTLSSGRTDIPVPAEHTDALVAFVAASEAAQIAARNDVTTAVGHAIHTQRVTREMNK